jgi:Uma2 family endonuclease
MFQSELPRYLPTADELPCSDDTPVDNELQELIPGLLKSILQILWADRMDWFFGITYGTLRERYGSLLSSRTTRYRPRWLP